MPVAGGLALAIAVAGLGHISGAHLNPAVTLGLAVNKNSPWAYAPGYVIAQFAGATAAAAVTWGLYGDQARSIAHLGAPAPAAGVPAGRVLPAEAVVTFVLVLVVVAVAIESSARACRVIVSPFCSANAKARLIMMGIPAG